VALLLADNYSFKGGSIGAAGAAMAAPLFSSNMGHALWPHLNWLSIRATTYGMDTYARELMVRRRTAAVNVPMAPTCQSTCLKIRNVRTVKIMNI